MKTRNKVITELRQEVAALDLANRHKDHQLNALWRTCVILRLTVGLPLTMQEENWLYDQSKADQELIRSMASTARAANMAKPTTPATTTSATPIKPTDAVKPTPKKRVRVKDGSSSQRWTRTETQQLHRFKAKGYDWNEISQRLNRSAKACQMQFYKTKNSQ